MKLRLSIFGFVINAINLIEAQCPRMTIPIGACQDDMCGLNSLCFDGVCCTNPMNVNPVLQASNVGQSPPQQQQQQEQPCQNQLVLCDSYDSYCLSSVYSTCMRFHCPQTCGLCGSSSVTQNPVSQSPNSASQSTRRQRRRTRSTRMPIPVTPATDEFSMPPPDNVSPSSGGGQGSGGGEVSGGGQGSGGGAVDTGNGGEIGGGGAVVFPPRQPGVPPDLGNGLGTGGIPGGFASGGSGSGNSPSINRGGGEFGSGFGGGGQSDFGRGSPTGVNSGGSMQPSPRGSGNVPSELSQWG